MSDDERQAPQRQRRWPLVAGALVIVAFVGIVLAIIFVPSRKVWTDDAYVTVHYTTVAPRISGQVVSVPVDDNQPVRAGQVLATRSCHVNSDMVDGGDEHACSELQTASFSA